MSLPWWGWLLVALWLACGVAGLAVFVRRFGGVRGLWYDIAGDEGFRPYRSTLRSIPYVALLPFALLLGPYGLLTEVRSQRREKQRVERMERLRERRRQRRASAVTAAADSSHA